MKGNGGQATLTSRPHEFFLKGPDLEQETSKAGGIVRRSRRDLEGQAVLTLQEFALPRHDVLDKG